MEKRISLSTGRLQRLYGDREALTIAKLLGAPTVIIHSVTTIHMGANADPRLMHDLNYDMFTRILPLRTSSARSERISRRSI
jgi:hypothetical protein